MAWAERERVDAAWCLTPASPEAPSLLMSVDFLFLEHYAPPPLSWGSYTDAPLLLIRSSISYLLLLITIVRRDRLPQRFPLLEQVGVRVLSVP